MPGGRSGGAGAALGIDYQGRIAAWFASQMLAAGGSYVMWDWPAASTVRLVATETADDVDDLRVENSLGDRAFIQSKHRLQLSTSPTSPLGKTLRQFVDQSDSLQANDRLVLATSSESSAPVREDLPRLLDRIRSLDSAALVVDSARNSRERSTLSIVVAHIADRWQELHGPPPSEVELRLLLRRIYVTSFDVYHDQPGVITAQVMLRTVLADPSFAAAAWSQLVSLLTEQAALQAGFTALSLEQELASVGIGLGATVDYRADIDRLRARSQTESRRLSSHQTILGDDGTPIRISRNADHELHVASQSGSLVVTGDPGAGKSGALAGLVDLLHPDVDVLVLSADTLSAQSLGDLRIELGLNHDLLDVLVHWRGDHPAYLIIDALDAARGSGAEQMLMDLVATVLIDAPRWRVVASVRRFDLRYGSAIQRVFRGSPASPDPAYQLDEFASIRHLNIPHLSPSELASVASDAPRLSLALQSAPSTLTTLLASVFSLRLFSELVAANFDREQMAAIQTRMQLLDAYWKHRVLDTASRGDRRELLLRLICQRALEARTLTVGRSELVTDTNADVLNDLLAADVLEESEHDGFVRRDLIGFAHHVFFDYAVARVILRNQSEIAFEELVQDLDIVLFARPSYQMHFEYLWQSAPDRCNFWRSALRLSSRDDLPGIAKVIAPAVAGRAISRVDDLRPLVAAIATNADGAVVCLRHVVGALLDDDVPGVSIPSEAQRTWAEFSATLAEYRREDLVGVVRALILELLSTSLADGATRTAIGSAGRLLLEWLWEVENSNRFLLNVAIRAVGTTFGTAPFESARLVRRILAPERMPAHAYIEVPILADEVLAIAPYDAELVRDIYVAAFEFKERSRDQTIMHSGVLNLSSNRRQDYESAHYSLGLHFPQYLEEHPQEAIEALARVRHAYSRRYGWDPDVFEVAWSGSVARIVDDRRFWIGDEETHDTEATLLSAFSSWLAVSDVDAAGAHRFDQAIGVALGVVTPAALWRSLLGAAARLALHDLLKITPLLHSPAALLADGTSIPIGDLLHERFGDLPAAQRLTIETAIWNLGQDCEDRAAERARLIRDRLLGCLEPSDLALDETRAHIAALSESDRVPQNRSAPMVFEQSSFSDNDILIDLGIDPTAPRVSTVLAQIRSVDAFASAYLNERPSRLAVDDLLRDAGPLWASMTDPDSSLPVAVVDRCWHALTRAARSVTRAHEFAALGAHDISTIEAWLVGASRRDTGTDQTDDIAEFDRSPSLTLGSRESAAEGLLWIAHHGRASTATRETIRALATDPSPGPRLIVAQSIRLVEAQDPELMWDVIDRGLSDESAAVAATSVAVAAHVLFRTDSNRLLQILEATYLHAEQRGARGLKTRRACIKVATDMHTWLGDLRAERLLTAALENVGTDPKEAEAIGRQLRSPFGSHDRGPRDRAFQLAVRICLATTNELDGIMLTRESGEAGDDETIKVLAQTIEHLACDYYFASGAYARTQPADDDSPPPDRADFYASSTELVRTLVRAPYPSVTHYVLQGLDYLLEVDPRGIFQLMAEVVDAGRQGNYEFDPQAAGLIVNVVQRFIADHRAILAIDADCRKALLQILNAFVDAGWPAARRLTYSLETIFR